MASTKVKGINIKIGADHVALSTALKDIEGKARNTNSELREIDRTIKTAGDSATVWKQKQDVLTAALEQSRDKLRLLESVQKDVNEQFKSDNINAEQYRAFQRETEKARAEVKRYESQLETASEKVKELGDESNKTADDVNEFADSTANAGEQAKISASGGITAMTVALGTLIADGIRKAAGELKDFTEEVVKSGAEFEAKMSNVKAISGATTEEFEKLNAKAQEMGATTKFTAAETADAFSYMAMAGWKANDMIAGIDGVLSLAAASGEDLATTSDIVTDAMTAFGLSADKVNHFADVLATASSNANTNVGMMGETFKYVAPIAGSLGYSVEDIAEAIGLMANNGIKGSQAGTSLRKILSSLTGEVDLAAESIGEVTIKTANADGSMRDFSDIISDLRDNFDKMSESEKTAAAQNLVGQEAMSGFLAIMNSAPADIDKLKNSIENCDGAAQNMAGTMIDNLSGDMTIFESAVDGAKIALSGKLNPALRDIVQYATDKVPKVEKVLGKVFETGGKIIKKAPSAAGALKKEFTPAVEVLGGALKNAADYTLKFLDFGLKVSPLSDVYKKIKDDLKDMKEDAALTEYFKNATKEADNLSDGIQGDIDKMQELSKTASEQLATDLADVYKTERLYSELQNLVDENGRVKAGYEDRVRFIVNELAQATGAEIELVDGQIQKYNELKETIRQTIEQQRASVYISSYQDMYTEALRQNSNAADTYRRNEEIITENKAVPQAIQAETVDEKLAAKRLKAFETYGNLTLANAEKWHEAGGLTDEDMNRISAARENITIAIQANNQLKKQVAENNHIIEQYEKAQSAYYSEDYKAAESLAKYISDSSGEILRARTENHEKAIENFNASVDKAVANYKASVKLGLTSAEDDMKASVNEAFNYLTETCGLSLDEAKEISKAKFHEIGSESMQEYIDSMKPIIEEFVNSDSVASRMVGKVLSSSISNLPFFADGGFLSSGQGIVAEAGPELLEVMNGGVKITPLTKSAQNSPVSSAAGTTIINNEIHANIASSYDVWKLAEDLSRAENIINRSLGK